MTRFHEFLVPEFRDAETFDAVRVCIDISKIIMFQEMIPEVRRNYVSAMMNKHKGLVPDFEWDITEDEVFQKIYESLEDAVFVEFENSIRSCFLISYNEMKKVMRTCGVLSSELSILND